MTKLKYVSRNFLQTTVSLAMSDRRPPYANDPLRPVGVQIEAPRRELHKPSPKREPDCTQSGSQSGREPKAKPITPSARSRSQCFQVSSTPHAREDRTSNKAPHAREDRAPREALWRAICIFTKAVCTNVVRYS